METTVPMDGTLPQGRALLRLVPLVLMVFLGALTIGLPLPVIPIRVHQGLGFGTAIAGAVVGIQSFATVATRGPTGRLADARGARRAALIGLLACALAGTAYLVSVLPSLPDMMSLLVLVAGRLILGFGESMLMTGALVWGIGRVGARHSGTVMSWNGVAMYGALGVGAPAGLAINGTFGFRGVAVAVIALPLAGLLIGLFLPGVKPTGTGARRIGFHTMLGRIWKEGAALALATAGFGVIAAFLSLAFAARGWSGAGLSLTAFGATYILARIAGGHLPDRIGGRIVALASLPVEVAGLLLLSVAGTPLMALLGAALAGLGFSLIFPALGIEAIRRVPPENRGLGLGAFVAFFDISLGVTGPVAGGIAHAMGYDAAFFAGAAAVALSLLLVLLPGRSRAHVTAKTAR